MAKKKSLEKVPQQPRAGVLDEQRPEPQHQDPRAGGLAGYLRRSIESCGLSPYEIARRAGIAPQQIYRFMDEGKTLTLETVDKLLPIVCQPFYLRLSAAEVAHEAEAEAKKELIRFLVQIQETIQGMREIVEHGLSPEVRA